MPPIRFTRREFIQTGLAATTALALARTTSAAAAETAHPTFEQPFRQVHLDFHTSRFIENVAGNFDAEVFADTLERAHVNSINCFGRCHHGFIYWDTKAFPERKHPHLQKPILNQQIDACHKRGIRVPIYLTVQWDYYSARNNPEWLQRYADGSHVGGSFSEPGFYQFLCVNTPYRQFLKDLIKDLFDCVPVDGVWLDIVKDQPCYCDQCRKDMETLGLDTKDAVQVQQFATQMTNDFKREVTEYIRGFSKDCIIFYNAGHVGPYIRKSIDTYSHLEMESLPSGAWGYLHLPLTARFARTLGKQYLGMTGKFHTSWGDFHSFKNQAALQFECFHMLALGAKCSVGDQLPPDGRIDPATYDLIGSVYAEVEKKEPWCSRTVPLTDIAVFTPEEFVGGRTPPAAMGAVRMLQEGHHQFDMVDSQSSLDGYRVAVLPDVIPVNDALKAKLTEFVDAGGALLATYESGLVPDGKRFALDLLGVEKVGEGPLDASGTPARGKQYPRNEFAQYVIPAGPLAQGLPQTEHVMYACGMDVRAKDPAEVLAKTTLSYFDRVGDHFSSHRQTPSSGRTGNDAIVRNGRCIYFAHPIFTQYHSNAPRWCKQLFLNALALLLPEPRVRLEAPSTAIAHLHRQSREKRDVLHLLHYIPERRGEQFDIVEDVIPLYDIHAAVRVDGPVQRVRAVPQGRRLRFKQEGNYVEFAVPEVNGHQMIEIQR